MRHPATNPGPKCAGDGVCTVFDSVPVATNSALIDLRRGDGMNIPHLAVKLFYLTVWARFKQIAPIRLTSGGGES